MAALVVLALGLGATGPDAWLHGDVLPQTAHSQPAGAPGDGPVERARGHLRANAARLGLKGDLSDLQVIRTRESLAGEHIEFQQLAGSYPVWGATVTVHVDRDRQREPGVTSRYRRGATPPQGSHALPQDAALQRAADHVAPGAKLSRRATGELVLYPEHGDRLRLAWSVRLATERPPGDYEVIVDAYTGAVLSTQDHARRDAWSQQNTPR